MRPTSPLWFALLIGLLSAPTLAQTSTPSPTPPVRDPQAIAWVSKALGALTGGIAVSDVTLEGNATRTAGSDNDSGSIAMKALGNGASRFDLSLASGMWSEVRNNSSGTPQGWWSASDGVTHPMANHNTLTDAVWFFPALSVLSQLSNANLAVVYVGEESRNGATVEHLRFFDQSQAPNSAASALLTNLSATDFYLDPTSALPVAVAFNVHADNNALVNIPVEIDFSGYQPVSGVAVPFHIQKLLNGTLFLDVTVQTVKVNSGLTVTDFSS